MPAMPAALLAAGGARPTVKPAAVSPDGDPSSFVDPFIGTGSGGPVVGQVDTFPGASLPFGMVQWSPDTSPDRTDGGGYDYADDKTLGLSLTHLSGPGCPIAEDVPFLPTTGMLPESPSGLEFATEPFSHAREKASPGFYEMGLGRPAVSVEVTATERTGLGQITFPPGAQDNLLIKAGNSSSGNVASSVEVVDDDEVTGSASSGGFCGSPDPYPYTLYFVAVFSRPFESFGTWNYQEATAGARSSSARVPAGPPGAATQDARIARQPDGVPIGEEAKGGEQKTSPVGVSQTSGANVGAWISWGPRPQPTVVEVKVGVSYVSVAEAAANLAAEGRSWNLAGVARAARSTWNSLLDEIDVRSGPRSELVDFYTALYHSLLDPSLFSDSNGRYVGFDQRVHVLARGAAQYTNFSGWDIYRSEIPLLTLVDPGAASQMMDSLVRDAQEGGWLPKWPIASSYTTVLNGDAADEILAEGVAFGARFNIRAALSAMVRAATSIPSQSSVGQGWYVERPGLQGYEQLGYVPNTIFCCLEPRPDAPPNGASTTLEYASADFAVAMVAERLGNSGLGAEFMARAQKWEALLDPENGYLEPRDDLGNFPVGSPLSQGMEPGGQNGFQEGDAAQYNWLVPQNLASLIAGMGGNAAAVSRLNAFFLQLNGGPTSENYWAGNEDDIEAPWVYDFAGEPWRTQAVVRRIIDTVYSATPGGEPGNDDLGAMSSWEVWAMLGMYPVTPGAPAVALGSPLFPLVVWHLAGGKRTVTISAPGASRTSPYVTSLKVNGRGTQQDWLPLSDLLGDSAGPSSFGPPSNSTGPAGGYIELQFGLSASPSLSWGASPSDAPPSYATGESDVVAHVAEASLEVAPGGSSTEVVYLHNMTENTEIVVISAMPAPRSGVVLRPSEAWLRLAPAGGAVVSLQVLAAKDARVGYSTGYFGLTAIGSVSNAVPVTVVVAPSESIVRAYDNVGLTLNSDPTMGNFDGLGHSYTASGLAIGSVSGRLRVPSGRARFTLAAQPDYPDNVVADGQNIAVNAPKGTRQLDLLGAATDGPDAGMATLRYADGTTQLVEIGLSDWTLNGGTAKPEYGNVVVTEAPYRNFVDGPSQAGKAYLFETSIPVDPSRHLVALKLPTECAGPTGPELHLFSVTTSGERALPASLSPPSSSAPGCRPPLGRTRTPSESRKTEGFATHPGDSDLASASSGPGALCSDTELAPYSPHGLTVPAGEWYAAPSECGPYPTSAAAGSVNVAMTTLKDAEEGVRHHRDVRDGRPLAGIDRPVRACVVLTGCHQPGRLGHDRRDDHAGRHVWHRGQGQSIRERPRQRRVPVRPAGRRRIDGDPVHLHDRVTERVRAVPSGGGPMRSSAGVCLAHTAP